MADCLAFVGRAARPAGPSKPSVPGSIKTPRDRAGSHNGTRMNQKEIKELIELLVEKDITEFELERGDMKLHVKRGATTASIVQVAPGMAPIAPIAVAPQTTHVAPI